MNHMYVTGDFTKEYFEPLNKGDIHTYLSPIYI